MFDGSDDRFTAASCAFGGPRLSAYSLPSTGATCGGSLSRYGRPIPNSFSCASIHFHRTSLDVHSLCTCVALHAYEIGRKPMAIATATAPAVVRAVGRSLIAASELLPVIIAECAGNARRKAGVLHRAKGIVELPFEVPDPCLRSRRPAITSRLFAPPLDPSTQNSR